MYLKSPVKFKEYQAWIHDAIDKWASHYMHITTSRLNQDITDL